MANKILRWVKTINYPSYVIFFVTAKCNANCKMCFYKDNMVKVEGVKNELTLEEYEKIRDDALEIASAKSEQLIESYVHELDKRSFFQYNMLEETKESKAKTSLERATLFVFEMKKLLK